MSVTKATREAVIEKIRQQLDPETCKRILRDTRVVTGWIYRIIKQACRECD